MSDVDNLSVFWKLTVTGAEAAIVSVSKWVVEVSNDAAILFEVNKEKPNWPKSGGLCFCKVAWLFSKNSVSKLFSASFYLKLK